MPTWGLCQRRRIVDAVAGHGDQAALGLQLLDGVGLGAGAHLGQHLGDAQFPGDGLGRGAVVAGQHHQSQPRRSQPGERLDRGRLDCVGQVEHAGGYAVDRHHDHRVALPARLLGQGHKRRRIDARFAQKLLAAGDDCMTVYLDR